MPGFARGTPRGARPVASAGFGWVFRCDTARVRVATQTLSPQNDPPIRRQSRAEKRRKRSGNGDAMGRVRTAELVVPRSMPTTFSARMSSFMGAATRRPMVARALRERVLPEKDEAPTD